MTRLAGLCAPAASPAAAQGPQDGRIAAAAVCSAVLERVQVDLAQGDRALQSENHGMKAPKKISALGFDQITRTLCQKSARPDLRGVGPAAASLPSDSHIRAPSHTR